MEMTPVKFDRFKIRVGTSYALSEWEDADALADLVQRFCFRVLGADVGPAHFNAYKSCEAPENRRWMFEFTISLRDKNMAKSELLDVFEEAFLAESVGFEVEEY